MNETTLLSPAGLAYLAEVRDALSDLDPVDRNDLMDEVEEHLLAIVDEAADQVVDHAGLVARLGVAPQYAADLRSAAGLPSRAEGLSGHDAAAVVMPVWMGRALAECWSYLRGLVPAWLALRGFLIAGLILTVTVPVAGTIATGWQPARVGDVDGPSGGIAGAGPYIVAVIALLMVVSIGLGRRRREPGSGLWLAHHAFTIAGAVAGVLCPMWWIGPSLYMFYRGRYGPG